MSLSGDKPHLAASGPTATPHRAVGSGRVTRAGGKHGDREVDSLVIPGEAPTKSLPHLYSDTKPGTLERPKHAAGDDCPPSLGHGLARGDSRLCGQDSSGGKLGSVTSCQPGVPMADGGC